MSTNVMSNITYKYGREYKDEINHQSEIRQAEHRKSHQEIMKLGLPEQGWKKGNTNSYETKLK